MNANGLELQYIGSTSAQKEIDAEKLTAELKASFPENGFAAAYLDDRVLIGRWNAGEFKFHDGQTIDEKYVQKIRVFNSDQEFLAWRTKLGFKGRLRKDFQGSGTGIIVSEQVLVGTKADQKSEGFTEISELRGARLIVPFENLEVDENKKRVFIRTHNYIEYNEVGQATYADCRFVAFTDRKNDLV